MLSRTKPWRKQLKAAGLNKYSEQLNNWGNTAGMIRDAKAYLEQNTEQTATFPKYYDDAAARFNVAWIDYSAARSARCQLSQFSVKKEAEIAIQ